MPRSPRADTPPRSSIQTLTPDPRNANKGSERGAGLLEHSLRHYGAGRSLLVDKHGVVIAGNKTLEAAASVGLEDTIVVPTDGTKLVVVQRMDLDLATDAKAKELAVADNRVAQVSLDWDADVLRQLADEGADLSALFTKDELADLVDAAPVAGRTDPDDVPEPRATDIVPGDLFQLGRHRLLCGDSTSVSEMAKLFDGDKADACVTDPPYCSGGFQESGRSAGSVGTSATHKQIANDRLSTRGYQALLKKAFTNTGAPYLYAFTDWRMWVWLFDIAESCGYGVRSMIVWDKGTPGMGRVWRSQHELVLWAAKATPPFDKHASGQGNVLSDKRTGNVFHTTEKPVGIMAALLQNTPFAQTIVDPFSGSGTTLIACEQAGRACYAAELDAVYCQVAIDRWEAFTGQKATKVGELARAS